MVWLYLLLVGVVFYWQLKRLRRGETSKATAIGIFAGCSIAPVILYCIIFFVLVGIEEIMWKTVIGEAFARSLIFVALGGVGIVIISTIVFSLVVLMSKFDDKAT